MALENKIAPNGAIVATSMNGMFMGNRGGRIHDPETRTLHRTRRWASRQWICCRTSFKNRNRQVMGTGYTELFFLDEVTALSAGHRPCFECRYEDAKHFTECWARAFQLDRPPRAAEMDGVLHSQRLKGRDKRTYYADSAQLPNGSMIEYGNGFHVIKYDRMHRWSPEGYHEDSELPIQQVKVITPAAIVKILDVGFRPLWHDSISAS